MSVLLICSMAFSLQITPVMAEDAGITDEISFYENVSEAEFAEDDTITVLIEFDYPENDYDIRETDSLESSQEQLRLLRASNRAYYTENNQEFIDELDIEYEDMEVSAYSPYVFITFDTWAEYTDARDDLIELSEDSKVKKVFAEETPVMEDEAVNVNTSTSSTNVYMDDAKKMIGVKNANGSNVSNYTGEGIRVGFIEGGSPDDLTNFANGQIKAVRDSVGPNDHATKVASIIGGTYGIAPDADLYFAGAFSQEAVEWLLSSEINVNIINMSSKARAEEDHGMYTGYDVYTDYISRINLVLFVKSAGNSGIYVGSPGLGLNVLTVGSVDANKNISVFSGHLTLNGFSQKPTFVAPGEIIIIPNTNNIAEECLGTSFSAPMVTGVAVLLMEEFGIALNYPDLLASALINGCEWLPGQTEMWDSYAGAGLVNYINTREILSELRYETAMVLQTEYSTTVICEVSTFLGTSEDLTFCLFDFARQQLDDDLLNRFDNDRLETAYYPAITKYKVILFDSTGEEIKNWTSDNNIIVGKYTNATASGTYYIRVYMDGQKQFASSEYLALTYSTTHEHSYTHSYSNPSLRTHRCNCSCGEYITEAHIYSTSVGGSSVCVKCGYISR